MIGTHHARFEIEPGSLPDMLCGNWDDRTKGVKRTQMLRPTYITTQWTENVLNEVRIWGPRVLKDGSLGDRELDYCWRTTRTTGPIHYALLPSPVADQLRSYIQ